MNYKRISVNIKTKAKKLQKKKNKKEGSTRYERGC
jgi:hypothetical protein